MQNNKSIFFLNRQFIQVKWLLALLPILIILYYFFISKEILGLILFPFLYFPIMFAVHPRKYILQDNQFIFDHMFFKNKVINISDITSIDSSKNNYMYLRSDVEKSFFKITISKSDMSALREELVNRNPLIELIND